MALVLAIEPDLRQAEILTRIVREKVKADLVIVDSRDAAMDAMRTAVPDVMLLSALLSPRDEDELVGHLRKLEGAEHLQTHTIPQLASPGGDGHSGPARGLLKAFRRKKDTAPPVSGCDPDLFAQEIRVFLQQAEQKRHERAEDLKYRPAAAAVKPAIDSQTKPAVEESEIPTPATSWDSPFEWRRSDTPPAPIAAFEEEPAPPAMKFQPVEEPAAEAEFSWSAHLLDPSSLRGDGRSDPEPPTVTAAESPIATDHLLEAHAEVPEPPGVQEQDEPAREPEAVETYPEAPVAQPIAARPVEIVVSETDATAPQPLEYAPETETLATQATDFTPEVESVAMQATDFMPEVESVATQATDFTPDAEAIPMEVMEFAPEADAIAAPALEFTPQVETQIEEAAPQADDIVANEPLDAPELFETFAPAPVEELHSTIGADALPAFEAVGPLEPIVDAAAPAEADIATPEEIEAYGRFDVPAAPIVMTPEPLPALDESFSIECIIDPEPTHEEPTPAVASIEFASVPAAASDEEEIDLSWSVDNLRFDEAADAVDAPHGTGSVDAADSENAAIAFENSEDDEVAAGAELAGGDVPARRPPVNLGPLATWARLERKTEEERRPGSDMREIIERLAVPPHVAGVSYARGVRIRRVRVAGTRNRRRPADQSGPVILSRRALAETRSVAP